MEDDMSASGTRKLKGVAYYHCPNRTGCGKYCEMNDLEGRIAKEFQKLQFSEEFIEAVIEKARVQLLEGRDTYDGRRQALVNKKSAFEGKLRSIEDKLIEGVLGNDEFTRLRNSAREKITLIEEELVRLKNEREVDIDVVQEILTLSKDIYSAYSKASFELKRQYLSFFWDGFEVLDGVILKSNPTPLFSELLAAQHAYYQKPKTEKALYKARFSDGILSTQLLRDQDSNLEPTP